jgi:SAM-dependent methyltransferase
MGVQERLSLEAISADTLIASEHVHRYKLAAALCAGLRVVDLACGSGYGSAILRQTAQSVVGVDNDAATIDMARATIGAEQDVRFEAADAVEFLGRPLAAEHDAIVCLEGLEHFADVGRASEALVARASEGMKLVVSVPNSRTLGEENEFHVTDFDFDQAMELAERLGDTTVLYQFLAEGSLIRGGEPGPLDAERVLEEHGEPAYANHFILCVNLDEELRSSFPAARMHLAAAPVYNRYMLGVERANQELWRENTRLARGSLGKSDAAAATVIFRLQRELRVRAERAEERNMSLEAEVTHLRHRVRLLDAPRHLAVERARDRVMRSPLFYGVVRRVWKLVRRG